MNNHSISSVKLAAKRILGSYFFRCVLATFISGTGIMLIFNYILDGTVRVDNAFDIDAFYNAVLTAESPQDIYAYIYNSVSSIIDSIGYDIYSAMLRRFAMAIILSFLVKLIYQFLVIYPFEVGSCRFYIDAHYTEPKYKQLLHGFNSNYVNVILIQMLRQVKIFLWSLLLIVPGIIKSYETFMIPYLLAENPDIGCREAFETSRRMMDGNKLNLFLLNLSFIGWMFLSTLTGGLAYIIFVGPYYDASLANMALRIKAEYNEKQ